MAISSLLIALVSACLAQDAEVQHPSGFWRSTRWSGANAVYFLLRTHEQACDYSKIQARFPPSRTSFTLQDVCEVALEFGLPCVVQMPRFSELAESGLPVIAHIEGVGDVADYRRTGRLVLVCKFDEATVTVYDCTTGLQETLERQDFARIWSGAVVAVVNGGGRAASLLAGSICALVAVSFLWCRK